MHRYLLFSLVLLFVFWAIPAAQACEAAAMIPFVDIPQATERASLILTGRITNVDYLAWTAHLSIEVDSYLKGTGFAEIELNISCASFAESNTLYIFFLDQLQDGSYILLVKEYQTFIEANSDYLAQIQAITNQSSPPQDLSLLLQLERVVTRNQLLLGQISLAVLGLSAHLGLRRFAKTARKKKKNDSL